MTKHAKRMILIGFDGMMLPLAERFMREGVMPNLAQLVERGVLTESLSVVPVDTPTNWTTIATGADSSTHGIHSFTSHRPGERLDEGEFDGSRNKHSTSVRAEFFWSATREAGLRAAVVNYPTGWPALDAADVVVGGLTPGGEPWRIAKQGVHATAAAVHSALPYDSAGLKPLPLEMREAAGWAGEIESATLPLEARIEIPTDEGPLPLWLLVTGNSESAYDTVLVSPTKDADGAWATLAEGDWTAWLYSRTDRSGAVFRLKLVHLSPEAGIELYRSDVFRSEGWTNPPSLARELLANVGPYLEGLECPYAPVDDELRPYGPINVSIPLTLELARFQAEWMVGTVDYLARSPGWDVLFLHYHLIDAINHTFLGYLYPGAALTSNGQEAEVWNVYRESYRILDEIVGGILESVGGDDLAVVVTSDHAALPSWRFVSIVRALEQAGLIAYERAEGNGRLSVDLRRSKVVPYLDPQYIWVNLQGREEGGIVAEVDYENVRDEVIDALMAIRDPVSGERPVELVCRREALGHPDDPASTVGDLVYFLRPGYSTWDGYIDSLRFGTIPEQRLAGDLVASSRFVVGHHTSHLPAARLGEFSNSAMTVFAGPGFKRGYRRATPIRLTDIAPTLARVLGIRPPANVDGVVRADLFE